MVVEIIVKPPIYMERHDSTIHVQWDPPYDGSYKFNVDDSYNKRNASSTLVVGMTTGAVSHYLNPHPNYWVPPEPKHKVYLGDKLTPTPTPIGFKFFHPNPNP
jgi:hypothetical protein